MRRGLESDKRRVVIYPTQVSFEKGVHFPHACEGIYWCTGKLLIINMDGCPKLLNEMLEPGVKTRFNVSGLMLLLTAKWNRVSPSLRVGPELQRTGTHFVPFNLVFKPLLSMTFMIYDVVNCKNQVMILSWFLGFGVFLFCLFFFPTAASIINSKEEGGKPNEDVSIS